MQTANAQSAWVGIIRKRSRRHLLIVFHCFSEKIRLDVSNESSARQRIHCMKNQALFSSKDKSKKLKCPLLQIFGALKVNTRQIGLLELRYGRAKV